MHTYVKNKKKNLYGTNSPVLKVKESVAEYVSPVKFTYKDILSTPDDNNTYELFEGELMMSPRPRVDHQVIMRRLTTLIGNYVDRNKLGTLVTEVELYFSAHTVLVPDLIFVAQDRVDIIKEQNIHGAPDWVCEILSPARKNRDYGFKLTAYERKGVPEYWIVDPKKKSVEVFVLKNNSYQSVTYYGPQKIRSEVFEKLMVKADRIFE